MSHFTVLVPADNEEDLREKMIPFKEAGWGSEDPLELQQYLEFNDTEDEDLEEYNSRTIPVVELEDGTVLTKFDEQFRNRDRKPLDFDSDEFVYPEGSRQYDMLANELYYSFEEYMLDWKGQKRDEKTGRYGYWHNPNDKWDWYQIGGRWTGMLQLKTLDAMMVAGSGSPGLMTEPNDNPSCADYASVGGVDWEAILNDQIQNLRDDYRSFQDNYDTVGEDRVEFERENLRDRWDDGVWDEYDFDFETLCRAVAAEKQGELWLTVSTMQDMLSVTEEEYINNNTPRALTYAFIDLEGNWNQRGEMGWWGISDEDRATDNYDEAWWQFIESLPDEQMVYVVDCHI